jgi:hypothetical protein
MKINKIEQFEEGKIVVEVEGYPHAQPTFEAKITPEELKVALKAWKVNQDAVDEMNRQAILNPKPKTELKQEIKDLENKEI